jgi:hypothetical protein
VKKGAKEFQNWKRSRQKCIGILLIVGGSLALAYPLQENVEEITFGGRWAEAFLLVAAIDESCLGNTETDAPSLSGSIQGTLEDQLKKPRV